MKEQSGAVSLFVVIFAMLIITVITVSFLRLTISDQNQASDNDLSQSAYDSALAGTEDAKRALLHYQQVCRDTPGACGGLASQLTTDVCNAAVLVDNVVNPANLASGDTTNPGEITVQQSTAGNDADLNQAYTCVKIKLATDDYVGTLSANDSEIVPLVIDPSQSFDYVTVKWYSRDDVGTSSGNVDLTGLSSTQPLLQQSSWPSTRPSVMRAQLLQFGNSFTLDSFDMVTGSDSNASTVFLYPTSAAGASTSGTFTSLDTRATSATDEPDADVATMTPRAVRCLTNVSAGGYACTMSLGLPNPVGGGARTAFLRLTPFYNATHFQVVLSNGPLDPNGTNIVKFKDVQPEIDATGRANDLFRRTQSRVNLRASNAAYPDATIDLTSNFCKDFGVTDTEYIPGSCTP